MSIQKYVVEFIGTLFLVFTVGMTVISPGDAGTLAPLAIGSALMVMVYAGGHVSGGHYNPAVTLAIVLRGKCSIGDAIPYVIVQCVGGVVAGMFVLYLKVGETVTAATIEVGPSLIAEFLFTFALCYVVLNVATAKANDGNSFYGLAIGMTVLVGAYAVGPISGGAFNPAVAIGCGTMGMVGWSDLWVHIGAEAAAAVAAALVFKSTVSDQG